MVGIPLGISDELLRDARQLPLAAQAGVTFAPSVGAVLTALMLTPVARRVPAAIPGIGGRRVPRMLPVAASGAVGVLILAYGCIGVAMMMSDLAGGEATVGDLASSWAATMTEIAFIAWGGALTVAAVRFSRATTCRDCHAGS